MKLPAMFKALGSMFVAEKANAAAANSLPDRLSRVRAAVYNRFESPSYSPYGSGYVPVYVIDVLISPDVAIYEQGGLLYKIGYSVDANGAITLDPGMPVQVEITYTEKASNVLQIFKDASGQYRWLGIVSNQFKDTDGDTIEEAAHLAYTKALEDGTLPYPQLWLWHTPGTKSGTADFVAYTDGFTLSSGVFDKDAEPVAENLAKMSGLGMSHGFFCTRKDGVIGWYADYEHSVLPVTSAANAWTAFESFQIGGATMALGEKQAGFLEAAIGPDRLKQITETLPDMAATLKALGVEYKALPAEAPAATAVPTPAAPTAAPGGQDAILLAIKALGDGMDGKIETAIKAAVPGIVAPIASQIAELQKNQAAQAVQLAALAGSDAEKLDKAIAAAVAGPTGAPNGTRPSADGANVPTPEEIQKAIQQNGGQDWFAQGFAGVVNQAVVG